MKRSINDIWSPCFVSCLLLGVLTSCAVGCNSGASPASAPASAANPVSTPTQAPQEQPKVVVMGGGTHDFGSSEMDQEFQHVFEIKNTGQAELTLKKGTTSCSKCTSFEVDKLRLKPNEVAKATVKWKILNEVPEFRQSATITTNDPRRPEVQLNVTGKVVRRFAMEPSETWIIGEVLEGQPKEFIGMITSAVTDKFEIESVTCSNPKLTLNWAPLSEEKLAELKIKKGYEVKTVLSPDIPVGPFKETIVATLLTPEPITRKVETTAKRSGPLQIFGPGWNAERKQLALSAFDPKQPLAVRLLVYTRGVPDETKIVKVDCADDRFTFELKPDSRFKGQSGDHRRYELLVNVAPSTRPAYYTIGQPLNVEIHTNQEKVKQISLKVTCAALP